VLIIYLLAALKDNFLNLHHITVIGMLVLYFTGLIGFIVAVVDTNLYGMQIEIIEVIYGSLIPIFLIVMSFPLVIGDLAKFRKISI
jgi:hypothetical protein